MTTLSPVSAGPLAGLRVLEIESIGPGPYAAMLLADLGASVLTVGRPGPDRRNPNPVLYRNRAGRVGLDLKAESGRSALMDLIAQSDALIEGFRPGVMERLQLGPEPCLAHNSRLVYGRITGWGREGPLAMTAGHDINYIALSGALHACGTEPSGPVPPLNLIGDFGGGGLMLAFGMLSALFESQRSGRGQVVDAAMLDGAANLMSMIWGMRAADRWPASRAGNLFDGSAWFYTTYRCADGRWVAVGAIEPEFRKQLLEGLGLGDEAAILARRPDNDSSIRERLASIFAARTRDHWQALFQFGDACVTPVLALDEVAAHPQNQAWGSVVQTGSISAPAPAPRFSRTPAPAVRVEGCADRLDGWTLPATAA